MRWRWTRGHSGQSGNERAHELAAAAIPQPASAGPRGGAAAAPGVAAGPPAGVPAGVGSGAGAAGPGTAGEDRVEVFLGVAWSARRQEGAWGAILRWGDVERELTGVVRGSSANAAHVAGAAAALAAIRRPVPVRVVTVSDYLRDGATQWLPGWRSRGWRTREGQPVASREWWERLAPHLGRLAVEWHVPGEEPLPPEVGRAREIARAALTAEAAG